MRNGRTFYFTVYDAFIMRFTYLVIYAHPDNARKNTISRCNVEDLYTFLENIRAWEKDPRFGAPFPFFSDSLRSKSNRDFVLNARPTATSGKGEN